MKKKLSIPIFSTIDFDTDARYTKKEIFELTGLEPRMIQFYTDEHIVNSRNKNPGRGNPRKYSDIDLMDFMTLYYLYNSGFRLSKIRKIFNSCDNPCMLYHRAFSIYLNLRMIGAE